MSWKGIAVGGFVGYYLGGPLGALFGAVFGNRIERRFAGGGARRARPSNPRPSACDAYATLGVAASATDEELRAAYRALAKRYHPDALRARDLSDVEIARAAERMKRINAAWKKVRAARGI